MRIPRIRRPRLSYANVAATLALVLAASMGGAYAHGMIGPNQIKNNAVKSRHIGFQQVKTPDIKKGAVNSARLRGKAVRTSHIRDHAMWALLNNDGSLIQGHGVADTQRISPGVYAVRFNKGVIKRPLTATVYHEFGGTATIRHCTTAHPLGSSCNAFSPGFEENPKAVAVITRNQDNTLTDKQTMVVAMPRTPNVFTLSPRVTPRGESESETQR